MPRLTGFEVLAKLASRPIVVFTTAYDKYALEAFGVSAADYLLKPVAPETLTRALDQVDRLRGAGLPAQPDMQILIRRIADSLRESKPEFPRRIASRLGDRLWFLDLDRVSHFYAEDKLTYAVSEGKAYFIDHTIAELDGKLDPSQFSRIHRGTVVNLAWIKEVTSLPGGALNIRLKDGKSTDLTVARDRARAFKERAVL
jgi:two-component system LytT family response regulator